MHSDEVSVDDLDNLNKTELKELCRRYKLPVSGCVFLLHVQSDCLTSLVLMVFRSVMQVSTLGVRERKLRLDQDLRRTKAQLQERLCAISQEPRIALAQSQPTSSLASTHQTHGVKDAGEKVTEPRSSTRPSFALLSGQIGRSHLHCKG